MRGMDSFVSLWLCHEQWGNEMAYKEFMNTGVLIHDIATSMDPVTTLNGEPALGHGLQWRKPFHYRVS